MAIRLKNQWFRDGAGKTPQQQASAMAFIAWRVTQEMLKRMRAAQFDIDIGEPYFAFTREVLVALVLVVDRMAHARQSAEERVAFVTALVRRVAEILQDNEDTFLGTPAAGQGSHFEAFIDLFNELSDHYAEFGFDAEGPDFAFMRYLGHRVEAVLPPKDRRWVIEQLMASELPDAFDLLRRGLQGVLDTEPRAARRAGRGVSGD